MEFEDMNSDQENIPPNKGRGRPSTDYKAKFKALKKRLKHAGIDVNSPEWFKKQCTDKISPELVEAKKALQEKDKEIQRLTDSNTIFRNKWKKVPFKDTSKMEPYSNKRYTKRLDVRKRVDAVVCSENPDEERAMFI